VVLVPQKWNVFHFIFARNVEDQLVILWMENLEDITIEQDYAKIVRSNNLTLEEREAIINKVIDSVRNTLIEKNRRYGSSTGDPINVFSSLGPEEGIKQRLDDKLKRIRTNTAFERSPRKNDVFDLIGYLVLYCVELNWDDFSDLLD